MRTRHPTRLNACALLVATLATIAVYGDTFYVDDGAGNDARNGRCAVWDGTTCGPKKTIQAGIAAATIGDTVIVANGTYRGTGNKDLDFAGKALIVRSRDGQTGCIIDCEGSGRGFYFHSGETAQAVVDGFTLRNGRIDRGAGVYVTAASPTIQNCLLTANTATAVGGAVYCKDGGATVQACTIVGNSNDPAGGAAAVMSNHSIVLVARCAITENLTGTVRVDLAGTLTLTDCTIASNVGAPMYGGAATAAGNSTLTLERCRVVANSGVQAGAIYGASSAVSIVDCVIYDNVGTSTDEFAGAAVTCRIGSLTMLRCDLANNRAAAWEQRGGAVLCDSITAMICACRFVNNWAGANHAAQLQGGAIRASYGTIAVENSTFVDNQGSEGGGAYLYDNNAATFVNCTFVRNEGNAITCSAASANVANCVFWDTDSTYGPMTVGGGGTLSVSFSDVQGGAASVNVYEGTLNWGDGNIDVDPQFALAADVHLLPGSPCIDAGSNAPAGGLPDVDVEGLPRPIDGNGDGSAIADMGAYEFSGTPRIALSQEASDFWVLSNGAMPEDQRVAIRNCGGGALHWEVTGASTWLQVTPQTGDSTSEIDTVTLSVTTTALPIGDYACNLSVTDPASSNSPRAITVKLHVRKAWYVPGDYATIQAAIDAAADGDHVVLANGVYVGTGNKDLDYRGKNVTVRSANGQANCIIDCEGSGRGFFFHSAESRVSAIQGVTIRNGSVSDGGGAIYCASSSPSVVDCILEHNTDTSYSGGAICAFGSDLLLSRCILRDNTAKAQESDRGGGGLYLSSGNPVVRDCVFRRNTATWGGALGFDSARGRAEIRNCVFGENVAIGAHVIDLYIATSMSNCVVWDNEYHTTTTIGAGNRTTIAYSDIEGGQAAVQVLPGGTVTWGEGNLDVDPLFTHDQRHLQAASPCRDAGDPALDFRGETDLDHEPRVVNGRVDIGVDEFLDSDDDGMPDWWERQYFSSDTAADPDADPDGDGRPNLEEYNRDTEPLAPPRILYVDAATGQDSWDGLAPAWDGQSGPKQTIQPAIDASDDDETVIVGPGTYVGIGNRDLDFHGKRISLRSSDPSNPAVVPATLLDCQGTAADPHRACQFKNDETRESVLDGFTITNGYGPTEQMPGWGPGSLGGALLCVHASPTIRHCVIENCTAPNGSCAMLWNSAARFVDSKVTGCGGIGAAFYCDVGTLDLEACLVTGNAGQRTIWAFRTASAYTGCQFTQNAGGISHYQGSTVINGCEFSGNGTATVVELREQTQASITNSILRQNGGGIDLESVAQAAISNCLIAGHTYGSAVWCWGTSVSITNCTMADNNATNAMNTGGGVAVGDNATAVLTNCVVWGNRAQYGSQLATFGDANSGQSLTVSYCDVQGGASGVYLKPGSQLTWGAGNLNLDPKFGANYHLRSVSPCIDAGTNTPPGGLPELDLDGDARVIDGDGDTRPIVDMGAYEFASHPYGDMNCDGLMNSQDIDGFVYALFGMPAEYDAYLHSFPQFHPCNMLNGDFNGDGVINNFDINGFVAALFDK